MSQETRRPPLLTELEFTDALWFKVFIREMVPDEVERVIALYRERKPSGQYFVPPFDHIALHELSLQMTSRARATGCRALDILHVAAALLCDAALFVTADKRQAALAEAEGREVRLITS